MCRTSIFPTDSCVNNGLNRRPKDSCVNHVLNLHLAYRFMCTIIPIDSYASVPLVPSLPTPLTKWSSLAEKTAPHVTGCIANLYTGHLLHLSICSNQQCPHIYMHVPPSALTDWLTEWLIHSLTNQSAFTFGYFAFKPCTGTCWIKIYKRNLLQVSRSWIKL